MGDFGVLVPGYGDRAGCPLCHSGVEVAGNSVGLDGVNRLGPLGGLFALVGYLSLYTEEVFLVSLQFHSVRHGVGGDDEVNDTGENLSGVIGENIGVLGNLQGELVGTCYQVPAEEYAVSVRDAVREVQRFEAAGEVERCELVCDAGAGMQS